MKFVRFKHENNISYGILEEENIHKINGSIYQKFNKTGEVFNKNNVKLLTPCEPTKIFCIGLNYMEHIKELDLEIPKKPAGFMKPLSSIINPGENIVIPEIATRVDYEGEIALVIKDKIKNISTQKAKEHILGITPFNDVTERELSYTPSLVTYSKAFDTFTSFGPVINTDVSDISLNTYLNGKKVQEGNTNKLIFSLEYIVSFLSKCMTLYPGDVITTGTPNNVLALKDGDKVEIEMGDSVQDRLVNYVYDPKKHQENN
ncbi:MAG: fumarylacetoacetate hydrolase family protein [Bacillota bacterium]